MDFLKQKNTVLRTRSKEMKELLIGLEDQRQSAILQAKSLLDWSAQLHRYSARLDIIIDQLPKAN